MDNTSGIEKYLLLINETFYFNNDRVYKQTVPTSLVVVLAFLYGIISLLAVIGNGLVILVIAKDKRMRTVTNTFIANLALSDVILGMFTTPFQFHPALYQRWDFPPFLCSLAPSIKVLSVSVSVLTLTAIAVDRYVAVMYPLKAGFSMKSAVCGLVVIWGISIASSFPEGHYFKFIYTSSDVPYCEYKWPADDFGKYYHLYLFLVQYLFPLLVINFTYARIACRIWGLRAPGNTHEGDNVRQRNRKKVVKMLIIVAVLFVFCWMPLQVYGFISELYPGINESQYIQTFWFCANWLAMSNACYNPFIYGLLNEKFKREYRTLFANCKCLKGRFSDSTNSGNDISHEINGGQQRISMAYRQNGSSNKRPIYQRDQPSGTPTSTGYCRFTVIDNRDESTSHTHV